MRKPLIPVPQSQTGRLLIGAVAVFVIIIAAGTLAYEMVEGVGLLEALYATLNTVTTVGRGMRDFSPAGKAISMVVMVLGIVTGTMVLGLVTRAMLEGQIRTLLGRKRMEKQIAKMSKHVVVCGYGRMGRVITREFAKQQVPFIVIEQDETVSSQVEEDGFLGIHGDATNDEILLQCGLERARALITVMSTDADNVFVTLSARQINPDMYILSRANEDTSVEKLKKAGADRVFSPYLAGGRQMAMATLRPNVIDFLAEIGGEPGSESYEIEELRVERGSPICGKSLRELNLSGKLGVIIIGLRRQGKPMTYIPSADTTVEGDAILIALGPSSRMGQLALLVSAS